MQVFSNDVNTFHSVQLESGLVKLSTYEWSPVEIVDDQVKELVCELKLKDVHSIERLLCIVQSHLSSAPETLTDEDTHSKEEQSVVSEGNSELAVPVSAANTNVQYAHVPPPSQPLLFEESADSTNLMETNEAMLSEYAESGEPQFGGSGLHVDPSDDGPPIVEVQPEDITSPNEDVDNREHKPPSKLPSYLKQSCSKESQDVPHAPPPPNIPLENNAVTSPMTPQSRQAQFTPERDQVR